MPTPDDSLEEFRRYLPSYLVGGERESLFRELRQFPNNIDERLFTTQALPEEAIYQGDGLPNVFICDLPRPEVKLAQVLVLSNSCDTSPSNERAELARLIYCPIMRLELYSQAVAATSDYLTTIRENRISTIFYLPAHASLGGEAVAFMDRINSCPVNQLDTRQLIENRLFTLSLYGFYLLLFKLSLHLTRMREGVHRG